MAVLTTIFIVEISPITLALSIEVIGLKKAITQLPITKTKKNVAMSIFMVEN